MTWILSIVIIEQQFSKKNDRYLNLMASLLKCVKSDGIVIITGEKSYNKCLNDMMPADVSTGNIIDLRK